MKVEAVINKKEFIENFAKENEGFEIRVLTKKYTVEMNALPPPKLELHDEDVEMYYPILKHVDVEIKQFAKEQKKEKK